MMMKEYKTNKRIVFFHLHSSTNGMMRGHQDHYGAARAFISCREFTGRENWPTNLLHQINIKNAFTCNQSWRYGWREVDPRDEHLFVCGQDAAWQLSRKEIHL